MHSCLVFNQISCDIPFFFQLKGADISICSQRKGTDFSQRNQGDFKTLYNVMILPLRTTKLENYIETVVLVVKALQNVVFTLPGKNYCFHK